MGLYDWLIEREDVCLISSPITVDNLKEINPDLVVSYNYKHIITKDVIDYMHGNIINLHISYLPWNRGASPNLWSFIDDTPKGVTIHQIAPGLDTGKILYRHECFFDAENETFSSVYAKLHNEIIKLFKNNWQDIKNGRYTLKEQIGKGSYHTSENLAELQNKIQFEWSDNIADFLRRYKLLNKNKQ